jgi:hypothetical protein
MEQPARNETRDYAWKYFALHADQRLRAFNFYLLIVAVILGGLLAYLKDARSPVYAAPAGFLLPILSYIFWRLDGRSQEFIRHAETVLKAIEKDIPVEQVPEELRLFIGEDTKTQQLRKQRGTPGLNPISWARGHFGYYGCFKAAFVLFALVGISIGVAAFFLPGTPPSAPSSPQQNFYIGNQPVNPAPQGGKVPG